MSTTFSLSKFTLAVATISIMTGCASGPYIDDLTRDTETTPIEEGSFEQLTATYVARYLMERDDRAELLEEVKTSETVSANYSSSMPAAASMAGDIISSQAASSLGSALGAAGLGVNLVLGEINDGSIDIVGQAYLPAELDGQTLETHQEAVDGLSERSASRIEKMAAALDWKVECLAGCGTHSQVFVMEASETSLPHDYLYRPNEIYAKVIFQPDNLVEVTPDIVDPISAFSGFPVRWKTSPGYTYVVQFLAEPHERNPDTGHAKLFFDDKFRMHYPSANIDLADTQIGTALLRMFHGTPMTMHGSKEDMPKLVFYNGEVYSFFSNSRHPLIRSTLNEEPLVDNF